MAAQKWTKLFERDYSIQYWENIFYMYNKSNGKFVIYPFGNLVVLRAGHRNASLYGPADIYAKHLQEVLKFYTDVTNAKNFLKEFNEIGEKYVETAKKVAKVKGKPQLVAAYQEYRQHWGRYTSALMIAYELNDLFADKLAEFIEQRYEKVKPQPPLNNILGAVLKPAKIAATVQAGIDAWKVKQNYSDAALEKFRKKYEWMTCLDLKYDPLTTSGAEDMVKNAQNLEGVQQSKSKVNVVKELKLTKEEEEFVEVARLYFYVKDLRDEFRRKAVFYAREMYKQMARELGISFPQTYSLTSGEILSGLEGKPIDTKAANARLNERFFFWQENGRPTCLTGEKAVEKAKAMGIEVEEKAGEGDQFTGLAACPGVVRGKVRKIKAAAHLNRVQKGEILVAVTTNPNYMSAMNLASAIVTDEGGLTSHAAIVSRELKKPCVVGAKVATKLLNDGDEVEVDGTKGTVKKIGT